MPNSLSRRQFNALLPAGLLTGAAAASSLRPSIARADSQTSPHLLDLAQLKYDGNWNPRPGAMAELATEVRDRSRVETRPVPSAVEVTSSKLFDSPFLYVAASEKLPNWQANELARLRRFVDQGGILVIDDADAGTALGLKNDVQNFCRQLDPQSELAVLPHDHVLYRSFYLVPTPMGRTQNSDDVYALLGGGRIRVLFFPNDLGGALSRDPNGSYRYSCQPGGEVQREWAVRFGINLVLYATCTDYKADPAHVETLLRRRVWR